MRNFSKAHIAPLIGLIALVAVMGFSMVACNSDSGGGGGGGGGGGNAKSIKVTGLDALIGSSYQLGLAASVDALSEGNYVAVAQGTIKSGTVTITLLDYSTGESWTGSGSYYVGIMINDDETYVTSSKKSFNDSVTTLSIGDFESID